MIIIGLLVFVLPLLLRPAYRPVRAAGLLVTSLADTVADDGICTLREAITAANTDTPSGVMAGECSAGSGPDIITFDANYTITLVGSQLPAVTSTVTITGNGASKTIIQAHGYPQTAAWRVFEVAGSGELTLDQVTVRHGRCSGACATDGQSGGGIYNGGSLIISHSTLSDNVAAGSGGGIATKNGTVKVLDSTLVGNKADKGGGISNFNSTGEVTNSTFTGNSAAAGGGVHNEADENMVNSFIMTVTGTTLSANTAGWGGGIFNAFATVNVTNSTLSGNSGSSYGGGLFSNYAKTIVTNSTFAGNESPNPGSGLWINLTNSAVDNTLIIRGETSDNCYGLNAGPSSIANDASCGGFTQKTSSEINLGPLQFNGGPTQTHALLPGSVAIDFNESAGCLGSPVQGVDQRGEPRNVNGNGSASTFECDAGAFELGIDSPTATASPSATTTAIGTLAPATTTPATGTPAATPMGTPDPAGERNYLPFVVGPAVS